MAVIAAVALSMVAAGCSSGGGGASPTASGSALPTGTVQITSTTGTVLVRVQIAETEAARERGLMGVRHLAPDAGMAFVFPRPTDDSFWMKDTLIPLSIAFWGSGGRIVGIREMLPCHVTSCPLYSPGVEYVGAVEANRGFFAAHGVQQGDPILLRRS